MAKVVNLNKFRKKAAKAKRTQTAEQNRARHGRSASEKKRAEAARLEAQRVLDRARLDDEP